MSNCDHQIIHVDVDGTIIDQFGNLYPDVERCLAQLTRWFQLICWSFGGKDYARKVCELHGLDKYFIEFQTKPQIIIDDDFDWIKKYPRKFQINDRSWAEVLKFLNLK